MGDNDADAFFVDFLAEYADRYYVDGIRFIRSDFSLRDDPGLEEVVTSLAMRFGYEPTFLADALKLFAVLYPNYPLPTKKGTH